jgi:hypothetical protein
MYNPENDRTMVPLWVVIVPMVYLSPAFIMAFISLGRYIKGIMSW